MRVHLAAVDAERVRGVLKVPRAEADADLAEARPHDAVDVEHRQEVSVAVEHLLVGTGRRRAELGVDLRHVWTDPDADMPRDVLRACVGRGPGLVERSV